jgi:hypothetical protein
MANYKGRKDKKSKDKGEVKSDGYGHEGVDGGTMMAKFTIHCDGGIRVVVDQSAKQGTYNDGIGISIVKSEGLLLQRWHLHGGEWREGMRPRQGMYIGNNGKVIGM